METLSPLTISTLPLHLCGYKHAILLHTNLVPFRGFQYSGSLFLLIPDRKHPEVICHAIHPIVLVALSALATPENLVFLP